MNKFPQDFFSKRPWHSLELEQFFMGFLLLHIRRQITFCNSTHRKFPPNLLFFAILHPSSLTWSQKLGILIRSNWPSKSVRMTFVWVNRKLRNLFWWLTILSAKFLIHRKSKQRSASFLYWSPVNFILRCSSNEAKRESLIISHFASTLLESNRLDW